MPFDATPSLRAAEAELEEHRERFTDEEEELFNARRYKELAGKVGERARQEFLQAVALLVAVEFLPLVYIVFALFVFDLELRMALGGLVIVLVLSTALPLRVLLARLRLRESATRAWALALEAERGPVVEGVDVAELVKHLDDTHKRLLEEGRLEEVADHLGEQGRRGRTFFMTMAIAKSVFLALLVAMGLAIAVEDGWEGLLVVPIVLGALFALYQAFAGKKEQNELDRLEERLRESLRSA